MIKMFPSKKEFYYSFTYWMSGPIAKMVAPFIIYYIGVSPIISPICVELTSYMIIKPIHYFIVQPFSYKLLTFEEDDNVQYAFI